MDVTDDIETDIAEHIRLNLPDVKVRTPGSGIGGSNKVRAATVQLVGGTPSYTAGRRQPEAAYADVLVTVMVGRAMADYLPARRLAHDIVGVLSASDNRRVPVVL